MKSSSVWKDILSILVVVGAFVALIVFVILPNVRGAPDEVGNDPIDQECMEEVAFNDRLGLVVAQRFIEESLETGRITPEEVADPSKMRWMWVYRPGDLRIGIRTAGAVYTASVCFGEKDVIFTNVEYTAIGGRRGSPSTKD